MLIISKQLLAQICQHAVATYPNECCGVIVGREDGGKRALGCYKVANADKQRAYERYQISADEHYQIDKQARANQLSIVGFYHSHPNSPPYPSAYDVQTAWPVYSYLIISVDEDKNTLIKSWVLANQRQEFRLEEICQR